MSGKFEHAQGPCFTGLTLLGVKKFKKGDIVYIHSMCVYIHIYIYKILAVASEFHLKKEMNVFVGKNMRIKPWDRFQISENL